MKRGITAGMANTLTPPDDLHDLRQQLRAIGRELLERDVGPLSVVVAEGVTVIAGIKRGPVKNILERRRQLVVEVDELGD